METLQKDSRNIKRGQMKQSSTFRGGKKEHTGVLSNMTQPGRQQKTTVVKDRKTLSTVKENTFTTSCQANNTLSEVSITLSKSTKITSQSRMRKVHHKLQTICKPQEYKGQIRLCISGTTLFGQNPGRPFKKDRTRKGWRRLGGIQHLWNTE